MLTNTQGCHYKVAVWRRSLTNCILDSYEFIVQRACLVVQRTSRYRKPAVFNITCNIN